MKAEQARVRLAVEVRKYVSDDVQSDDKKRAKAYSAVVEAVKDLEIATWFEANR